MCDVINTGADALDVNPLNDWGFQTVPQKGANNRRVHFTRGKGLGGTTQKNFMLYQRPNADAFDLWENATASADSPGWSWKDVFPYFTKSAVLSTPKTGARGPGKSPSWNPAAYPESDTSKAPLPISFPSFTYDYTVTLRQAFNDLGYPNASDFNSGTLNGVSYATSTINLATGHRSTSQSFLDNARSRSNLHVITLALVKRVNLDKQLNAVSVSYTEPFGAGEVTISAKREIILSAGAFQSPQLHIFMSPSVEINPLIFAVANALVTLPPGFFDYVFQNGGALTNPTADMLSWQKLNSTFFSENPSARAMQDYPEGWPHLEYLGIPAYVGDYGNAALSNIQFALSGRSFYSLPVALVVAVEAYRKVRRIFNTAPFKAVRINSDEFYPGYEHESDAEILEVIRNSLMTVQNPPSG
ncbi:hypothetical protein RQP46_011228 [Phenoliferia psychrophenolica]